MKNLMVFFSEVKYELSRVVWPSRSEFVGSIIVVLITMAAFTVFLGCVNYIFHMAFLKGFQALVLSH